MKKTMSLFQALMLVILIFSPVVSADEREQSIDIDFSSKTDTQFRQNLINEQQLTTGMETWAIQPQGVYSGPVLAESIMEFDYELRANQLTDKISNTEATTFESFPTVNPGTYYGYEFKEDADLNCYGNPGANTGDPDEDYFTETGASYPCRDNWYNSDNSVDDPYGRDDVGKVFSDYVSPPNSITFDTEILPWGENSYHSYFSVSVPVQFSHQDIMSGASEFWVRSPIDGVYDKANSHISIFEIDNLDDVEFNVEATSILNESAYNNEWNDVAYNPPETVRNSIVTHANGTLIYDNSLNGQEALAFDFSEGVCATIDNGTIDADAGSNSFITANGKNIRGPIPATNAYCPDSNFPVISSKTISVASTQTLQLETIASDSLTRTSWDRTYHRVNSFIYPNQPYLFVFLLELKESNPIISWTAEDINGAGQNTFIRYGEFNYSNPYDENGQLQFIRNPFNHFSNTNSVALDTGTSFVFTQGQSQDMAGYRFNADNTTISFMKELPRAVSHSPGDDGLFDIYDGDNFDNDDELDFVSIYMPFINHDRKDISIEYMALAYEIQDDGDIFLKQWMNASRMDCYNDTSIVGSAPDLFFNGKYDDDCDTSDYPEEYNLGIYGTKYNDAMHNYYYSGFWYYGYPDEGLSIRSTGDGPTGDHNCQADDPVDGWWANCRSDDFQRRAGVLNDESTNSEYFRKQYQDYFLHTAELIPENGTTHILYVFKIAGIHHWQSNIEDVCFFCDAQNPFESSEFTSYYDGSSITEINRITSFNSERDSDNDGRTDVDCDLYSCQQNSTDITLLIKKPSSKPGQRYVPLPMHSLGPNTTCVSRESVAFSFDEELTDLNNNTVCPNVYKASINSWSLYQEYHDRNGHRIDGARNQLITESSGWNTAYSATGLYCDTLLPLHYGSINSYGWNVAKPCVDSNSDALLSSYDGYTDDLEASGIFEINGRSASYTSITDFEYHATELTASVSLTQGRWTEVKGTSQGFDYLDNTFRHKIVQKNVYTLTIVTSNYDKPECPVGTEEIDGQKCATPGDAAINNIYHDTLNVLGDINQACNPVRSQNTYWDVSLTNVNWGDCSDSIKSGIAGAMAYDFSTIIEGAQQIYGYLGDAIDAGMNELKEIGTFLMRFATEAVGVIFSLFHEIGSNLDEILTGFLYLAGLLGLSFFLQLIVRFGTSILISLEDRGVN